MCDTLVRAPPGGPVWLAGSSDRQPDEARALEIVWPEGHAPRGTRPGPPAPLRARARERLARR